MMGSLFSRHRDRAVASITPRRKFSTSRWVILSNFLALGSFRGSAA
jgi:hypothetical protein